MQFANSAAYQVAVRAPFLKQVKPGSGRNNLEGNIGA